MNLQNKTVLVTGASSGIGQAIATSFAKAGATVLIHYRKNKEGAEKTLTEVEKSSNGHIYQADLSDLQQTEKMFSEIQKDVDGIDILINNAGHAGPGDFFDNSIWEHQYQNIFLTTLYPTQYFLKQKDSVQRKIINITSLYGNLQTGNPEYFQYSVAKAALNSLTANLAKMLGNSVLVNAIVPGYVWTPPWEGISKQEKKHYEKASKIERFIEPEEIAHVALMLAENDAITGEIITVDGGVSLMKMNQHDD